MIKPLDSSLDDRVKLSFKNKKQGIIVFIILSIFARAINTKKELIIELLFEIFTF